MRPPPPGAGEQIQPRWMPMILIGARPPPLSFSPLLVVMSRPLSTKKTAPGALARFFLPCCVFAIAHVPRADQDAVVQVKLDGSRQVGGVADVAH